MINNFLIRAFPGKNQLHIVLDGFFMKSEIELAFYLIKNESKKLNPGYEVLVDIKNLHSSNHRLGISFGKIKKMLKLMGSGELRFIGLNYAIARQMEKNGGIYSYENEWLSY